MICLNKPSLDLNNESDNSLSPTGYNKFITRTAREREQKKHGQNETFWQVPAASVNVTHSDSWFSTKETLLPMKLKQRGKFRKAFEEGIWIFGVCESRAFMLVFFFLSSSSSRFTYIESAAVRKLGQMIFFTFFLATMNQNIHILKIQLEENIKNQRKWAIPIAFSIFWSSRVTSVVHSDGCTSGPMKNIRPTEHLFCQKKILSF